jgi:hypothetical protein
VSLYCALVLRRWQASVGVIFVHLQPSSRGSRQPLQLRLVLSLGQGISHRAAFPATARGCGPPSAYATDGMDVGFHMGRRGAALPATGPARSTSRQSPGMDPMAAGFVNLAGRTTT